MWFASLQDCAAFKGKLAVLSMQHVKMTKVACDYKAERPFANQFTASCF